MRTYPEYSETDILTAKLQGMMGWYVYSQNNSGGSFEIDRSMGIGERVLIEAIDCEHANLIAQDIGLYFNGCESGIDCDCCGDRWCSAEPYNCTTLSEFKEREAKVRDDFPLLHTYDTVFLHYIDGTFKELNL